jgi:hypothetical protein
MTNKPGDIINVFSDPVNLKQFEGQAKLLTKENEFGVLERWTVYFTDDPNQYLYSRLIRKQEETVKI